MNKDLQARVMALKQNDDETRARLITAGTLYDGYNQEMETVHVRNADELEAIINQFGWPIVSLVGAEAAEAAFVIAHHAISEPAFQRTCLALIGAAVRSGDVPVRHEAMLLDRIRFNERQPQVYGTIFDWDEKGEMSPWTIAHPETVDARRAEVGLMPLADQIQRIRAETYKEGATPPVNYAGRQREIAEWSRAVGWV
jgi:hypothetical protein